MPRLGIGIVRGRSDLILLEAVGHNGPSIRPFDKLSGYSGRTGRFGSGRRRAALTFAIIAVGAASGAEANAYSDIPKPMVFGMDRFNVQVGAGVDRQRREPARPVGGVRMIMEF